jgi:hypothetical protein
MYLKFESSWVSVFLSLHMKPLALWDHKQDPYKRALAADAVVTEEVYNGQVLQMLEKLQNRIIGCCWEES